MIPRQLLTALSGLCDSIQCDFQKLFCKISYDISNLGYLKRENKELSNHFFVMHGFNLEPLTSAPNSLLLDKGFS